MSKECARLVVARTDYYFLSNTEGKQKRASGEKKERRKKKKDGDFRMSAVV